MAKSFLLEIFATDRNYFTGQCEQLVFPATDGLIGILPGHDPMVAVMPSGEIKFMVNGEWRYAATSDGYVEVSGNKVTILTDSVENPDEIDIKRAEAAKIRAEEKLKQKESIREFYHTQAALNRAMNRLKVSSKHFKD